MLVTSDAASRGVIANLPLQSDREWAVTRGSVANILQQA